MISLLIFAPITLFLILSGKRPIISIIFVLTATSNCLPLFIVIVNLSFILNMPLILNKLYQKSFTMSLSTLIRHSFYVYI